MGRYPKYMVDYAFSSNDTSFKKHGEFNYFFKYKDYMYCIAVYNDVCTIDVIYKDLKGRAFVNTMKITLAQFKDYYSENLRNFRENIITLVTNEFFDKNLIEWSI